MQFTGSDGRTEEKENVRGRLKIASHRTKQPEFTEEREEQWKKKQHHCFDLNRTCQYLPESECVPSLFHSTETTLRKSLCSLCTRAMQYHLFSSRILHQFSLWRNKTKMYKINSNKKINKTTKAAVLPKQLDSWFIFWGSESWNLMRLSTPSCFLTVKLQMLAHNQFRLFHQRSFECSKKTAC